MYYNFTELYQTTIPNQIESLCELIDDIHKEVKKRDIVTRNSNSKDFSEYGFYIDSADKGKNIYCGMWFALWETKGFPFCISLDWKKNIPNSIGKVMEEIVNKETNELITFINYEEYPTIIFEKQFFDTLTDARFMVDFIKTVSQQLKFNLYFKK